VNVDWNATRYELCLDGTWTSEEKNAYERAWVLYLCLLRYEELCIEHGRDEPWHTWQPFPESVYHIGLLRACERLGIPCT
jgi:hypothetical protein